MKRLSNLLIRMVLARARDPHGEMLMHIMLAAWAFFVERLGLGAKAEKLLAPIEEYAVGYNKFKIKEAQPDEVVINKIATIIADVVKRSGVKFTDLLSANAFNIFPHKLQSRITQLLTLRNEKGDYSPLVDKAQYPNLDLSLYKSTMPQDPKEAKQMANQIIEMYRMKSAENEEKEKKQEGYEKMRKRKMQEGTWVEQHKDTEEKPMPEKEKKEWSLALNKVKDSYLNPKLFKVAVPQGNTTDKSVVDISKLPGAADALKKKKDEMMQQAVKVDQISKTMKEFEKL